MTPPCDDGITALSYPHWMKTLETMQTHPSCDHNTRRLAEIAQRLFQINKHDPETIAFMNATAHEYMEKAAGDE